MVLHVVIPLLIVLAAVYSLVNERRMARRNDRAPRRWYQGLNTAAIALGVIAVVLAFFD